MLILNKQILQYQVHLIESISLKVFIIMMIIGLHSSWITDSILAMQRPNDKILEKGILQEFINNKLSVIFNLTEVT